MVNPDNVATFYSHYGPCSECWSPLDCAVDSFRLLESVSMDYFCSSDLILSTASLTGLFRLQMSLKPQHQQCRSELSSDGVNDGYEKLVIGF